jgi:TPR repeat protein
MSPMCRVALLALLAMTACKKKPRESRTHAAADGGIDPSFAVLRSPTGQEQVSPPEAVRLLTDQCYSEHPTEGLDRRARAVSCFSLGQMYGRGTFVAADPARAILLFEKSCDDGEPRACTELGVMIDAGEGVPADRAAAQVLFRKACDAGHGLGCNNLLLLHPDAVAPEVVTYVLGRYRAICDGGGDGEACATLGSLHLGGAYVPEDPVRAAALFAAACERDHPMGCNNLGAMHQLGKGVAIDDRRSLELFTRACHLGSREGCLNAGIDPATAAMQIVPAP